MPVSQSRHGSEVPFVQESEYHPFDTISAPEMTDFGMTDFIIRDLFYPGEMSIVFGPPGSGKSLISLHFAGMIAKSVDTIGGRPVQGRPALYVGLEGRRGMSARAIAFQLKHGEAGNLHFMFGPLDLAGDSSREAVGRLVATIQRLKVGFVVIDTLAQSMGGADENSSVAMGTLLRNVRTIADRTGAHICFVDHSGWSEEAAGRPRGHSSKWAACDAGLRVVGSLADGPARVEVVRLKDGVDRSPLAFASDLIPVHQEGETPVSAPALHELDPSTVKPPRLPSAAAKKAAKDRAKSELVREIIVKQAAATMDHPRGGLIHLVSRGELFEALEERGIYTRDPGGESGSDSKMTGAERTRRHRFLKSVEGLSIDEKNVWVKAGEVPGC